MTGSSVPAGAGVSAFWIVDTAGGLVLGGAAACGLTVAGAVAAGPVVAGAVAAGAVATGAPVTGALAGAAAGAGRDAFGERSSTGAAVCFDAQPAPSIAITAASINGREIFWQRQTIIKSKPPQSAERN